MSDNPQQRIYSSGAVELAVFEWPGTGRPIFFAHANGFHARCWDQVVAHLPGRHCYALDLRGHGRSAKPAPPYRWHAFGEDIAALAGELGLHDAIGVGHSVGGFATVVAATLNPTAFASLLLIDPVILLPEHYGQRMEGLEGVARRRNHWSSPHAMFERFKERKPFSSWQPAVLHDYCTYGLLRNPSGHDYVLACPPAIEAEIYAGCSEHDIYREIAAVKVPVVVMRANAFAENPATDLSASPTNPALASYFAAGRDVYLEQYSHFIPMENPALVAEYIRELM